MALKQESAPTLTPSRLPAAYRDGGIPPLATEDFDDVVRSLFYPFLIKLLLTTTRMCMCTL